MIEATLRFRHVLARCRLNPSTAHYVLRNYDQIPGISPGEGQGKHRQFDTEQAFRFAMAVWLVSCGVMLRDTAGVIQACWQLVSRPEFTNYVLRVSGDKYQLLLCAENHSDVVENGIWRDIRTNDNSRVDVRAISMTQVYISNIYQAIIED